MDNIQVLKLDSAFQPLEVISWQEAFLLTWLKKAYAVELTEIWKHSTKESFQVPSVIALFSYVEKGLLSLSPNRNNIYARDHYTCQYCGVVDETGGILTIDHVVPRSKGGGDEWNNVVTACMSCNGEKSDSLLKNTRFHLKKKPRKPSFSQLLKYRLRQSNEKWLQYLQ